MEHLKFEWNQIKNISNKNKHGISFEEAQTVFYDEMALVCHCYRESDTKIRIISARKATKTESQQYYKF